MAKLNQIIAVEKGIKSKSHSEISELYKLVQKPVLFNGFSKNYKPLNEDDTEKLPPEQLRVQITSDDAFRAIARSMKDLIQITARKDFTNCIAHADVVVDGKTVIAGAPVPFLLFLEKQLGDLNTFVKTIPVLDEAEDWNKDARSGMFKSGIVTTHRTKKTQRPVVLYQATPEHPAQTAMVAEDVISGHWNTIKMSGALPKPDKEDLLRAVEKLHNAVKTAREAANMADEVEVEDYGSAIFDYLFPTIKE
jgi:hypothetical protein